MEVKDSSQMSVPTRAAMHHIPEDEFLKIDFVEISHNMY
jgi:hypothetical protein